MVWRFIMYEVGELYRFIRLSKADPRVFARMAKIALDDEGDIKYADFYTLEDGAVLMYMGKKYSSYANKYFNVWLYKGLLLSDGNSKYFGFEKL